MPKKKTENRSLVVSDTPRIYPIAGTTILPTHLYRVRDRHPSGDGPWKEEADKIGWIDERTGLACIILRQKNGTLSGYVGVGQGHPLFGYSADAIPADLGVLVHGGLTYAEPCEKNVPEPISICHPAPRIGKPTDDMFAHSELWWFGFDTDHAYDYAPVRRPPSDPNGTVYRDQSYVYRECVKLAAQLHAFETGKPVDLPADIQQPIPPIGGNDQ